MKLKFDIELTDSQAQKIIDEVNYQSNEYTTPYVPVTLDECKTNANLWDYILKEVDVLEMILSDIESGTSYSDLDQYR